MPMLMMRVMKVLKGQQRIVRMLPRPVRMFQAVNLVMVKSAPVKTMKKKKMMQIMMIQMVRLKVRVRLREWSMHMMLMKEHHCHFQNVNFTLQNLLQSMCTKLFMTRKINVQEFSMGMIHFMCFLGFIRLVELYIYQYKFRYVFFFFKKKQIGIFCCRLCMRGYFQQK